MSDLLDLLLTKALVEGLARAAHLPENFKVLRPTPASWRGLKEAVKERNNVVAFEITDSDSPACRRTQEAFVKLAREHSELNFVRAEIDRSGYTFPELREDLGNVQYTPTFVFAFFNDDGTEYAKYEGVAEITEGIESGRIDAVIQELMKRRKKLKVVEGVAELAAMMKVISMVEKTMASDDSHTDRTVCELCKESYPDPVTYHMKGAHPGCGRSVDGFGYDSTGVYRGGWLGDCGDGGSGPSTWYLMCMECRARYLASHTARGRSHHEGTLVVRGVGTAEQQKGTITEIFGDDLEGVVGHFNDAWHPSKGACPAVKKVFEVTNDSLRLRWQAYGRGFSQLYQGVEKHFHGTALTCNILSTGALCRDTGCGICGISNIGLDPQRIQTNTSFQRFGNGYYLAPQSSKCNDYIKANSWGHRAMLLCYVLPGRIYKTAQRVNGPVQGYNSVEGVVGRELNYPEIVLYTPEAVLPRYIIVY